MSIPWLNAAMEDTQAKNGARLMLFVLADRANEEGISFYSIETLMHKTNLGKSAAHAALRELIQANLLDRNSKKGPHGCNLYRLLLTVQNPHRAESAPCGFQPEKVRNPHKEGAESAPNPSEIHQEPSIPSSRKAATTKYPVTVVDEIYQAYPRKKAPAEAKRAIAKHLSIIAGRGEPKAADWLLGQVRAFAKTRVGEEEKYTPYPATWINAGSYDEDFSAPSHGHNGTTSKTKPIASMSALIAAHQQPAP